MGVAVAIEAPRDGFADLTPTMQEEVISRLLSIVTSEAPPSSFIYEEIANLDIIRVGRQCRLYTKVVDEIPRGNTEYHVIYLFFIDPTHDYTHRTLAEYNFSTERRVQEVTALQTVPDVEEYLDDHDALGEDELRGLLP